MKKILLFVFALVSAPATAFSADAPATYYVPPAQFNAALQVMDMGFSNVFALFQSATGSFAFDEAGKSISRLRIALDATSLVSGNPDSQRGLANLLGIMQYPEIRITAPDSVAFADGKAELKGTLTLHGVSKPITFEVTLNHVGKSPRGGGMWSGEGDAIGLSLKGNFKRADFGIGDDPGADAPARFGDTLTLMLEMQGIRQ
jgi:polyisoprenoid-binding protein YceI